MFYNIPDESSKTFVVCRNIAYTSSQIENACIAATIVRTLREEQPLRLLLNLLFYHFNRSEPTYKSQRIAVLHVIAACNQLNVNALN